MALSYCLHSINQVLEQNKKNPHSLFGMHKNTETQSLTVRIFCPEAESIELVNIENPDKIYKLNKTNIFELFELEIKDEDQIFSYKLNITDYQGKTYTKYDPYSFLPSIDSSEFYYFNEGTENKLYEKLGSHYKECMGISGVSFTVWAPEAASVSLIADFNNWHKTVHCMRALGSSGIWEIFIPEELAEGSLYKFRIETKDGRFLDKADPMAFYAELRPNTSSRTWKRNKYEWNDQNWLTKRKNTNWHKSPVSIYEIHLGSWKRKAHAEEDENAVLSYIEYADQLIPYIQKMGFTHVEFMPLTEFPFDGSWGYQVSGYYAPTARFGNPDELKYLIDKFHQAGIGVLLDWVPAHFPKDAFGLANFDGSAVYEHGNSIQGEHPQWGTLIFNYGRTEVQSFLNSNAFYWIEEFHIDGLRVDAVSSMVHLNYGREETGDWIPNKYGGVENLEAVDFLRKLNKNIHLEFPDIITMAEEATDWPCVSKPLEYHDLALGFDFKWDMGWMHDTLKYMKIDPLFRKGSHDKITFSMAYFYNESFILPLSHDEVVHLKGSIINKMSGDYMSRFQQLKLLYAYQYAHPGKKLLFMGAEMAQESEWAYKNSLDWFRLDYKEPQAIQKTLTDLNNLYKQEKALSDQDFDLNGFQWINPSDADNSVYSFVRKSSSGENIICLFNFTPVPRYNYLIGCPTDEQYTEIFNSDWEIYAGSGKVLNNNPANLIGKWISHDNQPHSICVNIPAFGAVFLRNI